MGGFLAGSVLCAEDGGEAIIGWVGLVEGWLRVGWVQLVESS